MESQLAMITIATAIFTAYNVVAIKLFGIPESLSNTYYLYQGIDDGLKRLFPAMMFTMVVLMLPGWLDIAEDSSYQFLAFLACSGILFVGFAPAFKDYQTESHVHTSAAIISAIASLLWICLVTPFWWFIPLVSAIVIYSAIKTQTLEKSLVFWLEIIAFYSTFSAIITYYLC